MAKYACNFSELNDIASNIKKIVDEIELDKWKENIDSMGATWTDKASVKFLNRIDNKAYPNIERMRKSLIDLADYLTKCSKTIYYIEDSLSQLDI